MELVAQTRIPFPRDLVFSTIRDRMPELAQYMPNVREIECKERIEEGPIVRFVNLWTAKQEIPTVARRYLTPEMLKWTDRAVWNSQDYSCEWELEVPVMPGVVECKGRNTYLPIGDETELRVNGILNLHLDKAPIPKLLASSIRPIVERLVIASLRPNVLSTGDAVTRYLSALKEPAPTGS